MTDTRTLVLAHLAHPDWNPRSESHGLGHDDATTLLDRHTAETRAAAYREAADDIETEADRLNIPGAHHAAHLRARADQIDPTT